MSCSLNALVGMIVVVGCVGVAACNGASERARQAIGKDGDKGFMYKTLTRGNHVRKYGVFIPLNYTASVKWPVIIFLQGVGEGQGMGAGDGKNLTVGLGPFVEEKKATFSFICIFPQSSGGCSRT